MWLKPLKICINIQLLFRVSNSMLNTRRCNLRRRAHVYTFNLPDGNLLTHTAMRKITGVIYNAYLHTHTHTHTHTIINNFLLKKVAKGRSIFLRPSFPLGIHYLNEVVTNGRQKTASQLPDLLTCIQTDTSNGLSSLMNLAV